jgi:integral membrane protein
MDMKTTMGRFRIMSILCGITLLIFAFIYMPAKYGFDAIGEDSKFRFFSIFHGYLYIVYILTVLQLGVQKGMSYKTMAGLVLAGTLPFVSFISERKIAKKYS